LKKFNLDFLNLEKFPTSNEVRDTNRQHIQSEYCNLSIQRLFATSDIDEMLCVTIFSSKYMGAERFLKKGE